VKRLNLLYYIFGIVLIVFGTGCQDSTSMAAPPTKRPPPMVTVAPVVKEDVTKVYELVGRTAAKKTVNLVARVQGYLEKRTFKAGEDVKKGDLLFVIEQEPYEIKVRAAKAGFADAKAALQNAQTYLRRLSSVRKGAVSQTDLDKARSDELRAKAQLLSAKANWDEAKLNLRYTKIRSPIDGRIGRTAVSIGNVVSPTTGTLATIVQLDPVYVTFTVSEAAVITEFEKQIEKGRATTFIPKIQLSNGTIYPYEGTEDFVGHTVDQKTGTITIRSIFPNPSTNILPGQNNLDHSRRLLLPGQFVKVLVRRDDVASEVVIPQVAIQEDQGGKFVLVVDAQNLVQKRSVTVGEKTGIKWVVKQGLQVGEMIITQGLQKVRPGIAVQVSSAPAPKPVVN
jgi:membrane fusion protein, multidrug efflux system